MVSHYADVITDGALATERVLAFCSVQINWTGRIMNLISPVGSSETISQFIHSHRLYANLSFLFVWIGDEVGFWGDLPVPRIELCRLWWRRRCQNLQTNCVDLIGGHCHVSTVCAQNEELLAAAEWLYRRDQTTAIDRDRTRNSGASV